MSLGGLSCPDFGHEFETTSVFERVRSLLVKRPLQRPELKGELSVPNTLNRTR